MVMEYTEELVRLTASMPDAKRPGCRVTVITLDVYDRAWNPERHDTLLRGPAEITYVFWDGDDNDTAPDVRVRPIIAIPSGL